MLFAVIFRRTFLQQIIHTIVPAAPFLIQRFQQFQSRLQINVTVSALHVFGKFQQTACRNGRRCGILPYAFCGLSEINRNQTVFRYVGNKIMRNPSGCIQIFFVFGMEITECKTVQPPPLSSGP